MRPRKPWRHLGISPKILVETVVLKGSAPLSGEPFLPFAESIVGERIRLKNFSRILIFLSFVSWLAGRKRCWDPISGDGGGHLVAKIVGS
jgi:hypothetical protein